MEPRIPGAGELPREHEAVHVDAASLSRNSSDLSSGTSSWSNVPAIVRGALAALGDSVHSLSSTIDATSKLFSFFCSFPKLHCLRQADGREENKPVKMERTSACTL